MNVDNVLIPRWEMHTRVNGCYRVYVTLGDIVVAEDIIYDAHGWTASTRGDHLARELAKTSGIQFIPARLVRKLMPETINKTPRYMLRKKFVSDT